MSTHLISDTLGPPRNRCARPPSRLLPPDVWCPSTHFTHPVSSPASWLTHVYKPPDPSTSPIVSGVHRRDLPPHSGQSGPTPSASCVCRLESHHRYVTGTQSRLVPGGSSDVSDPHGRWSRTRHPTRSSPFLFLPGASGWAEGRRSVSGKTRQDPGSHQGSFVTPVLRSRGVPPSGAGLPPPERPR